MKYLIVLLCLLIPNKSYEMYHALLVLVLLIFMLLKNRFKVDLYVILVLGSIGFLLLSSLIRSFYFENYAIRDFVEVIRFVPLLLLLGIKPSFNHHTITKIFLFYLAADFSVSITQFLMLDVFSFITNLYGSSYHLDTSLLLNNRATGLSTGPGQHGTVMSFFYVYFLFLYLYNIGNSKWQITGIFMATVSLLLSQSQTSFIAIGLITVWMVIYTLWNGNSRSKTKSLKLGTVGALFAVGVFMTFFEQLRYLLSLFTLGLERNSFQRRLKKLDVVVDSFKEFPEGMFFGFGNDFFGSFARAMDNEYLYIFSIYGAIIGGMLFFLMLLFIIMVYYKGTSIDPKYLLIAFILSIGLIIAYPTVFFTETRIMFLVGVLFFIDLKSENIELEAFYKST